MRFTLSIRIDARALVLENGAGIAQTAVSFDRIRGDGSALIIGERDDPSVRVDVNVTRSGAPTWLPVQRSQRTGSVVELECGKHAAVDAFDRVERPPIRVDRDEGGILEGCRGLPMESVGVWIEAVSVYGPVAFACG
ncbi:hypothetical protein JCM18750_40200 [Halostagnicola bangensis]